eukprot:g10495.t1 g10495   contig4:1976124-1977335(+)
MLVSFSNSGDTELRTFAAFAVAQMSRNSDMMEIVTEEGGLEPVLYLARSDDKNTQREVLPALTTLSFLDCNKVPICMNGALPPIVGCISEDNNDTKESQMACCAIANLVEAAENMQAAVNHGCLSLLIEALDSKSEAVQREAARAVGNFALNVDYCDMILSQNVIEWFLKHDILDLVKTECYASLDPKRFSDYETVRFCLLIISNLSGGNQNHYLLDSFFDILMDFTRHRDVKCRQYAVLALGNLCTNPLHAQQLISAKCMDALVSFSFPPTTDDSVNAQFQAIGGLHGLSKHANLRVPILREGGLEPLILGARGNNRFSHVEIKREAAAALSNLALAQPK